MTYNLAPKPKHRIRLTIYVLVTYNLAPKPKHRFPYHINLDYLHSVVCTGRLTSLAESVCIPSSC